MKLPPMPKERADKIKQLEVELRLARSTEEQCEIFGKLVGACDNAPPTKTEQKYLNKLTDYIDEITNILDDTFKVFEVESVLDGVKKEKRNFYTVDHVKVSVPE